VRNPVFGSTSPRWPRSTPLDGARNRGAAVLLISEDLDELLELSDRIVVMSEGRIVHETPAARPIGARSARTWAARRTRPRCHAHAPA
jgi:ABC-type glutathione transport system ATPase component